MQILKGSLGNVMYNFMSKNSTTRWNRWIPWNTKITKTLARRNRELNSSMSTKKNCIQNYTPSHKENFSPNSFTGEFNWTFNRVSFRKQKVGTLPNSFYQASIILIPKSDRYDKKNFEPISPVNINTKSLNKILTNQI